MELFHFQKIVLARNENDLMLFDTSRGSAIDAVARLSDREKSFENFCKVTRFWNS